MIYVLAAVVLILCAWALRDEFRPGESLFPAFDGYYDDAELLVLPLADGWEAEDVLMVLAEIEAL